MRIPTLMEAIWGLFWSKLDKKLLPYPKIAQYFCPKKGTGGGGWSKAVRSFSEISSIFVGRGLPSFNLGKFKPEIPIDPTPLEKFHFLSVLQGLLKVA